MSNRYEFRIQGKAIQACGWLTAGESVLGFAGLSDLWRWVLECTRLCAACGLILMGMLPLAATAQPKQSGDAANVQAGGTVPKLIVIGFMGGNVSSTNLVHREATLIESLKQGYPLAIHAALFANRDGDLALRTVLQLLGADRNGLLTEEAKREARIVIFGHSWGASQTVALADRLNRLGIPVLLTIQVDSVQKQNQNDWRIPPNVREAVNFYQAEGLLRGRKAIVAEDPAKTKILGNHESSYRENSVSVAGYPWYARAFMRRHIQIENDPVVWGQIETLILAKIL